MPAAKASPDTANDFIIRELARLAAQRILEAPVRVHEGQARLARWRVRSAGMGGTARPGRISRGGVGWCLSALDLAVVKLDAAREKYLRYVREMLRAGLASAEAILQATDACEPWFQEKIASNLAALASGSAD